ncbi:Arabinose efflux permease [Bordetella trematum]|nr:Arabinose efflux permease [Bordetella trematum]
MTWILQTQPRSVEVASALYVSTFNTAIALGAWGGGELVDRLGVRANLALAAALTALALLLSCLAARQQATRPCAAGDEPADRA